MSLRRRVASLENSAGVGSGFLVITVHGGFVGLEREHATAGALRWARQDGETSEQFRERAIAEARGARSPQIVFGGLPR